MKKSGQFLTVCLLTFSISTSVFAALRGDVNEDNDITLVDVILGLRVISGQAPSLPDFVNDVDGDGRIDLPDILHSFQIISNNEPLIFTVTSVNTGRVWMDRNLGASRVATSATDTEAYGDLYQWGRGTDGHEKRDSGTTYEWSITDTPGHSLFILDGFDWRENTNDDLWQGVSGINNPCPAGFRVPTYTEWDTEVRFFGKTSITEAFNSQLKLVAGGYRDPNSGNIVDQGTFLTYWTSTAEIGSYTSHRIGFDSDYLWHCIYPRSYGFSIRCIQD